MGRVGVTIAISLLQLGRRSFFDLIPGSASLIPGSVRLIPGLGCYGNWLAKA
jgi:hypothetical protein